MTRRDRESKVLEDAPGLKSETWGTRSSFVVSPPIRHRGSVRIVIELTNHLVDFFAVGVEQGDCQRHLPEGVRRAAQAGVESTDHRFYAIQNAFGELAVLDVVLGGLCHA